jgi:membrane protein YdbS with pleckstrin-like domain
VAVRSLMWLGLTIGLLAVAPGISWLRIPLFALWALVTAALAVFSQRWPAVAYRHFFYRVDQRGIEIKQGVLWRTVTTVPRSRVQHIDVSQGPFERRLDLGTVTIHTAGTQDATVSLPGLEYGLALALREHLLPKREHDVV